MTNKMNSLRSFAIYSGTSMKLLWNLLLGVLLIGQLGQGQTEDLLAAENEATADGGDALTEATEEVEEPEGPGADVSQPDDRQPCAMWMGGVPGTPGHSGQPGRDGRDGHDGLRGERGDKG